MTSHQIVPMPRTTGAEPCTKSDGFFLDDYTSNRPEVIAATALCCQCPLARTCLIWSLANLVLAYDGIWGATTPSQRMTMRHDLLRRLGAERMAQTLRTAYAKAVADLPKDN